MKNEKELNELSEKIMDLEKKILLDEEVWSNSKMTYEIALSHAVSQFESSYFETKDKSLSTVEKRTLKAEEISPIRKLKEDLKKMKNNIDLQKIELRHLQRMFSINLQFSSAS